MRVIRVWFEKYHEARYISHLDLNRYMPRALRRAKIPAWYTEGYNKHLYINFAVPLSMGFESRNDCFEIKITDDCFSDEKIINDLNLAMPLGIKIVNITQPEIAFKNIRFASYKIYTEIGADHFEEVNEFLALDKIDVLKKTKRGENVINLKDCLFEVSVEREDGFIVINATLPAGCVNNINPTLILSAFNAYKSFDFDYLKIIRTGFKVDGFKPFK